MYISSSIAHGAKSAPQGRAGTSGNRRGTDDEAAASAEASRKASAEWFKRFQEDCKGIRISPRLSKDQRSSYDEELLLRKRLKELPELFEEKAKLDRRANLWPKTSVFTDPVAERRRLENIARTTGALSRQAYRVELARLLARLGYPPHYHLRTLQAELAQARCELSRHIWRSITP